MKCCCEYKREEREQKKLGHEVVDHQQSLSSGDMHAIEIMQHSSDLSRCHQTWIKKSVDVLCKHAVIRLVLLGVIHNQMLSNSSSDCRSLISSCDVAFEKMSVDQQSMNMAMYCSSVGSLCLPNPWELASPLLALPNLESAGAMAGSSTGQTFQLKMSGIHSSVKRGRSWTPKVEPGDIIPLNAELRAQLERVQSVGKM